MNFWDGKNVIVTGANGFLGSWLTGKLVQNGASVVTLLRDDIPNSNLFYSGTNKRVSIVWGDLSDFDTVRRALNEYSIDTVFHIGAQAIVSVANQSPLPTFFSNIVGTWNVLEASRLTDTIGCVIMASSDKAYGKHEILPYTEDAPLLAKYPYDVSKACADMIARSYWATYRLPVGVTRCANLYGGGDLNFSRIVPDAVKSVLYNRQPVIRSDGTPIREYFYIEDAVEAYLSFAEKMRQKNLEGEAINFGTGEYVSVMELVKRIIEASGRKLEPKILGKGIPHGEIDKQYLSSEKARRLLGWSAKIGLDEGLKKTIDWYRTYFKFMDEGGRGLPA